MKPADVLNPTDSITITEPSKERIEQLTKQVAKGAGLAFGAGVIGKIGTFGLHAILARVLGPGAYGLYALAASVMGIAQSIASLGLKQGVVRFCAMYRGEQDDARVKGAILSALKISSLSSALIATALFAFSGAIAQKFFHEPQLSWVLRMFALALPFYVLMELTSSFAQSFKRIEYQQGVLNIFRPLSNLALVGMAFALGFRLAGAVYGFLVSGVLSAGLGFYFLWKVFPEVMSSSKVTYRTAHMLRFSMPMFLIGISYLLLSYTDRIMLGYLKKASDVGIYNAASMLSINVVMFIAAIINIFSPIIADLYNRGKCSEMESLYKVTTRWILVTSLPLFLLFVFFPDIMMSLFGAEYQEGAPILILLTIAFFVGAATGPGGVILQMSGRQDIDLINTMALVIGNIALNILLIPAYGMFGAALATCITLVVVHLARFVEVYKIFKMMPYDFHLLKPFIAGIIAGVSSVLFKAFSKPGSPTSAYMGLLLLLLVYGISLWGMRLHPQDKVVLLAIIRRFRHAN